MQAWDKPALDQRLVYASYDLIVSDCVYLSSKIPPRNQSPPSTSIPVHTHCESGSRLSGQDPIIVT